ncbi:MAG: hypothetical protein RL007_2207 [Bacteroidota bacterium]|jgi:hypothetical protein
MKKSASITFFVLMILAWFQPAFSQTDKHVISIDFGSYRNRYAFAMNNVRYDSPALTSKNISLHARLRCYGTWFLYSHIAYDITPWAEYPLLKNEDRVSLTAGLGADIRLRFLNDSRSEAVSSAEPLVAITSRIMINKFGIELPLWTRFYSNGISFAVQPQFQFDLSERLAVFARYELTYLTVYGGITSEWRQDSFIGASMKFGK